MKALVKAQPKVGLWLEDVRADQRVGPTEVTLVPSMQFSLPRRSDADNTSQLTTKGADFRARPWR